MSTSAPRRTAAPLHLPAICSSRARSTDCPLARCRFPPGRHLREVHTVRPHAFGEKSKAIRPRFLDDNPAPRKRVNYLHADAKQDRNDRQGKNTLYGFQRPSGVGPIVCMSHGISGNFLRPVRLTPPCVRRPAAIPRTAQTGRIVLRSYHRILREY
jgi:hypothetical protein